MKKILLGIALIPIFSFAQNPFDFRTNKSKVGKAPSVEAENVDGRIGKTLDNSTLASGIYFIEIYTAQGKNSKTNTKIIK
ncbi:MAG: hypothetical protein ACI9M3_002120 [Bacteroidia bacterium]|jgi:hypothetical protein